MTTRNRYEATTISARDDDRRKDGLFVYVSTPVDSPLEQGSPPPYGPRGVDVFVDEAWDAYNRYLIASWRIALPEVIERVLGVDRDEAMALAAAAKYDRKLGCTCPCSPGFRIKTPLARRGYNRYLTAWATLTAVEGKGSVRPIAITYEGEVA